MSETTPTASDAVGSHLRDDVVSKCIAAHRRFPSGVTVVTTFADDAPHGLAVNAFSSVSMEPPMGLVCIKRSAQTHAHLAVSDHIGINILAGNQEQIARSFAVSGGNKFDGVPWHATTNGGPLLDGVAAAFEVQLDRQIVAGSHTIFIGNVVTVEVEGDRQPLIYLGGGFFDGMGDRGSQAVETAPKREGPP